MRKAAQISLFASMCVGTGTFERLCRRNAKCGGRADARMLTWPSSGGSSVGIADRSKSKTDKMREQVHRGAVGVNDLVAEIRLHMIFAMDGRFVKTIRQLLVM